MNSSKQIRCANSLCAAPFNNVKEGFTTCLKCSTTFIVLCHEFPLTYHKNLKCTKCPNKFYYYPCQKCQSLIVEKNHRVGTPTSCKVCTDQAVFITCGVCYKPFRSSDNRNMQGGVVRCRRCQGNFCYLTCQKCLQPIYSQKVFEFGEKVQCKNMKCRAEQTTKICKSCNKVYASCLDSNIPHFCSDNNIPVYQSMIDVRQKPSQMIIEESVKPKNMVQSKKQGSTTREMEKEKEKNREKEEEDNSCIVCMDKARSCVNTSCFHLNVCQGCVPKDGKCPLCRVIGEYKKVFI